MKHIYLYGKKKTLSICNDCGFVSFMCLPFTVTLSRYQNKIFTVLPVDNIMTKPESTFDLINQSALTLKHMVCIRICMKGTGPVVISHFGLSAFKRATKSDALELMMESPVVFLL